MGRELGTAMSASVHTAASITARLDRLPASREIWKLVILLSLGGGFELYDLLMTGYVAPGLVRSGIFSPGHTGLFGLPDQAAFASVTFAGLFIGTICFGYFADRFGRRNIFTWALLWYSLMTVIMATQSSVLSIDIWRFIAGVGIGVELVTIDTYIAELVPTEMRGRAFTVNQVIQFCSVPMVALLSWLLVPIDPFGIAGWRFVAGFPAIAAVLVFWIIRIVPESPRWLAQHGRLEEADRVTSAIEARVAAEKGPLPPRTSARGQGLPAMTGRERYAEPKLSPLTTLYLMPVGQAPPCRVPVLQIRKSNDNQSISRSIASMAASLKPK